MTTNRHPHTAAPHPRKVKESLAGRFGAMTILILLTFYFIMPVWFLLVSATKSQGDFTKTFGLWFSKMHFTENLSALFSQDRGIFPRWALNSLIYSGGGALIATLLSCMTGYALAKYSFKGHGTLLSIVLGGVLVPSTALALPLFLMFSRVGLVDTYWAVLLPSIVNPFGVFLAQNFANAAVPNEVIDSARIDGSGEFRAFFQIALRLMTPGVVTIFLFQFIGIWNNFFLPQIMLQSKSLYPLTLGLFNWNASVNQQPSLQPSIITGSFISVVPLILLFLLLQRYWTSGLSEGAIK